MTKLEIVVEALCIALIVAFVAAFFFFVGGCAHGTYKPPVRTLCDRQQQVFRDVSISPEYDEPIAAAVEYWNAVFGWSVLTYSGEIDRATIHGAPPFVLVELPDIAHASVMQSARCRAHVSFYSGGPFSNQCIIGATIWLDEDSVKPKYREAVITHELGHTLGLTHSVMPYTVMFPTLDYVRKKNSDDTMSAIARLYRNRKRSR